MSGMQFQVTQEVAAAVRGRQKPPFGPPHPEAGAHASGQKVLLSLSGL